MPFNASGRGRFRTSDRAKASSDGTPSVGVQSRPRGVRCASGSRGETARPFRRLSIRGVDSCWRRTRSRPVGSCSRLNSALCSRGPTYSDTTLEAGISLNETSEFNSTRKMRASTAYEQDVLGLVPLIAEGNFIRATRDSGYKSTAAALSELIDNALQAGAHQIRVFAFEKIIEKERDITLAVMDDGGGMDQASLQRAVQFGGSSRFDDRSGLGRYGMGLPNSSVSQARRLEVMSWREAGICHGCQLDVDELLSGNQAGLPAATLVQLPSWAQEHAANQGTLVIWSRCDRLPHKKAVTLVEKLTSAIGRTYRRALWDGVEIRLNERLIEPVDPMFAHPKTMEGGGILYAAPLKYRIRVPGRSEETVVEVRFVELPVRDWHALPTKEKRAMGIVGGSGVSILRAGREIDFGWHFMGSKRRENYDDWWRCEISFVPAADELFGVTHSKQGIAPRSVLRSILSPDIEGIARVLNRRAREAFDSCRESQTGTAAAAATSRDEFLPPLRTSTRTPLRGSHFKYQIQSAPLPTATLFSTTRRGTVITVRLNSEHPFVQTIYRRATGEVDGRSRLAIEKLILAAARARLSCTDSQQRDAVDSYISEWSDVLAAFTTP